jgi:transposase
MSKTKTDIIPVLYENAAGIDISSTEHYVAVNPSKFQPSVRAFGSFTENLLEMVDWLKECNVSTIAMEATGIYWVSLYLALEEAGFEVMLVTAKHVKNVRGKKTDVSDAEWIRQLHSCGLLSASFQPDPFTRKLRSYSRLRKSLIQMAATHVRVMHKAFEQMNVKLQHVIADITGKSGMAIIKAILTGERDPKKLSELCDGRIKASKGDIISSLNGFWKEEHLFELEQSFKLYNDYRARIRECDDKINLHLSKYAGMAAPSPVVAKPKENNLNFKPETALYKITGTELSEIFGITSTTAVELISEIGLNMNKWPTSKHFTAWLNLAPNVKISGGKILSSRIAKKKNHASQVFRMAAFSIQRSKNWLSLFYHRLKAKKGPKKALVATARKIAVIFYKMMKDKVKFDPLPIEKYNADFKDSQIRKIKRQAQKFGYQIVPN